MNDSENAVTSRLKCWSGSHNYVPDRAEDREPEGYVRYHRDGSEEPIPACYVVERCRRCGSERRVYSSVDIAKNMGVPFEGERSIDTENDR